MTDDYEELNDKETAIYWKGVSDGLMTVLANTLGWDQTTKIARNSNQIEGPLMSSGEEPFGWPFIGSPDQP